MKCEICNQRFKRLWPWQKTCRADTCRKKHELKKHLIATKTRNLKLFNTENIYSRQKHKYNNRIIRYSKSLTKKAYIGLAKAPLMKNDNGIGFKGVLLQSENRELVECSECGTWMKQITSKHLKLHDLTANEYKEKYGLNVQQGLVSDITKGKRRDKGIVNLKSQRMNGKKTLRPNYVAHYAKKPPNNTIQYRNLKGTCEKQLEQKMVNFIHRFKRIPTSRTKSFPFSTYTWRFGGAAKVFRHYGLPIRSQGRGSMKATKYTFPDGETFLIKDHDPLEYAILYDLMIKKCPILTNK